MRIRQEENTPIGDYFHDSGAKSAFGSLESIVDDFDLDTDTVAALCDKVIECMKGLKGQVKKVESAWVKQVSQDRISEMISRGMD